MTNDLWGEIKANWLDPASRPMDLYIGPPVPMEDLRAAESTKEAWQVASERFMAATADLAEQHRQDQGEEPQAPTAVAR